MGRISLKNTQLSFWWKGEKSKLRNLPSRSRDGAMVRALAPRQCGPGSIPGVICGLSLLLVLVLAPRIFLRVFRFSSLHKTNISKFHLESVDEKPLCGGATANSNLLFYLFIFVVFCCEAETLCKPKSCEP